MWWWDVSGNGLILKCIRQFWIVDCLVWTPTQSFSIWRPGNQLSLSRIAHCTFLRGHKCQNMKNHCTRGAGVSKKKNGLFDNKVSRVCSRTLFILMELRGLSHVTSMCPNEVSLQVRAWTAGSASGRALLCTYTCTNSVSDLSGDEVMQNDISCSCFCMWLITLADKGSPLSLLGVSKQARLSLRTSPELDVALLIPSAMWGGRWSLRRKWMFCKRDEGVEGATVIFRVRRWYIWKVNSGSGSVCLSSCGVHAICIPKAGGKATNQLFIRFVWLTC